MKTTIVKVDLKGRGYEIYIAKGALKLALAAASDRLENKNPVAFVSEENIWGNFVKIPEGGFEACEKIIVDSGEKAKRFENFEKICSRLARAKVDRSGCVFAFGGGVVGDLAGFAAASYMRGIDFYQVPTTLLACVDSSVGGKTGINISEGKNLVGAFHQPRAVFIDTNFLETLPPREFSAGMAEVIKYGMLGDAEFFATLCEEEKLEPSGERIESVIARCCRMKARIVSQDEFESAKEGGRALLNLGHTFAHAVENTAGYGNYLHGEAVGLGLLLAARMSERLGMLGAEDVFKTESVLKKYGLPVKLREGLDIESLLNAVKRDKKTLAGASRFVLMDGIGKAAVRSDVPESLAREIFLTAF